MCLSCGGVFSLPGTWNAMTNKDTNCETITNELCLVFFLMKNDRIWPNIMSDSPLTVSFVVSYSLL